MGLKYSPAAEMRFQSLTLFLVNLAGIMERADESLLPGVYKEVGAALETDPTGLGSLTLFRSIVQSSCYPLAAYLSIRHNRTHVIALGAFLWAAATFLVGMSSTFAQVAVSRGLNGIGLAIVTPAIQSLVADSTEDSNRGTAFGWLQLTGNFGSIIGGLLALLLASTSVFGISGWRIAFHIVGLISVVVGLLVGLFAKDPRFFGSDGEPKQQPPPKSFKTEIKDMVKEAKAVVKIPSFQILIAQGVAGSFPWSGLSFAPMWLELKGFSHETTAVLWTIFAVAQCVGSLFGGKMGDVLAKPFPNGGRIILSQVSAGSVIPLAAILLLALPNDASSPFSHGLVLVIMGFTSSWNAPATNNPIFAEIVPERARTSIYAWDQSFESILASFAPPIVGFLAQHVYGFKPQRNSTSSSSSSENTITNRENAASLAKALYPAIGIPMVICVFFYSFLYCTYPRDRDRAKMDALIESEMQRIDMDSTHSKEDQYIRVVDASEYDDAILHLNEKSGIDVDCEENDELEFENDEKKLLSHQTSFKANNT